MTRIVLTPEQVAQINGGRAEFVDSTGNLIGHLFTEASFTRLNTILFPEPTPEDIAEARKEMLAVGGVSTEELLASLDRVRQQWEALR